MGGLDVRLTARWCVAAHPDEVAEILGDLEALPRWWPRAHLAARMLARRDDGTRDVLLRSSGSLPGSLRWRASTREAPPRTGALVLDGAVAGSGTWTLRADGPYTIAEFAFVVRGRGLARRLLGVLLAPLWAAQFREAMRGGELALRLELRRRHAVTAHERAMIPDPPGPVWGAPRNAAAREFATDV